MWFFILSGFNLVPLLCTLNRIERVVTHLWELVSVVVCTKLSVRINDLIIQLYQHLLSGISAVRIRHRQHVLINMTKTCYDDDDDDDEGECVVTAGCAWFLLVRVQVVLSQSDSRGNPWDEFPGWHTLPEAGHHLVRLHHSTGSNKHPGNTPV